MKSSAPFTAVWPQLRCSPIGLTTWPKSSRPSRRLSKGSMQKGPEIQESGGFSLNRFSERLVALESMGSRSASSVATSSSLPLLSPSGSESSDSRGTAPGMDSPHKEATHHVSRSTSSSKVDTDHEDPVCADVAGRPGVAQSSHRWRRRRLLFNQVQARLQKSAATRATCQVFVATRGRQCKPECDPSLERSQHFPSRKMSMTHGDSSTPWTCLAGMSCLPCRV